nr:hypothetical protein [Tanacetum cinerariifolium]
MWHTLQLDGSKEAFKFFIDRHEVKFNVNDLRTVLQLPLFIINGNAKFVEALEFLTITEFLGNKSRGMGIPDELLTEEIKQTDAYKTYTTEFAIVVPIIQPQLVESSQGTHKTLRAPRPLNPNNTSKRRRSQDKGSLMLLRFRLGNDDGANEFAEEMILRQEIPTLGSRESKGMTEGKGIEEIRNTPIATPNRSLRNDLSSDNVELWELTTEQPTSSAASPPMIVSKRKKHLLHVVKRMSKQHYYMLKIIRMNYLYKNQEKRIYKQANDALHDVVLKIATAATNGLVEDNLPWLVDVAIKAEREKFKDEMSSIIVDVDALWNYMNNNILHVHPISLNLILFASTIMTIILMMMLILKGRTMRKGRECLKVMSFIEGVSSSKKKMNESQPESSTQNPQQEYDPWVEDQEINDDDDPYDDTPPESLMMLTGYQQLMIKTNEKPTLVVQGCARDLKAPTRCLYNEDLYYLNHGNIKEKNYVLSLHKINATSFPELDLEEKLNGWVEGVSPSKHTMNESQPESSTQQPQQEYDPWVEDQEINDDDDLYDDTPTQEDIIHQFPEKPTPAVQGCARDLKSPAKEKNYVLSLHKINATSFLELDLEEKLNEWVGRVFKHFKFKARYTIQHQKSSWGKTTYIKRQLKTRSDIEEVYSNYTITEVIKVKNVLTYKQDIIVEIVVRRANEHLQNELMKSLTVYIRSCVIWERFHDFHLGLESYQAKINLTAPTLTILGIENLPLHTIITEPFFGLVYENCKEERKIMSIDEILKFCDATLKKLWKEVKDINVEIRRGYYKPTLTKDKKEIMDSFEEEIKVRLKHQNQMRR